MNRLKFSWVSFVFVASFSVGMIHASPNCPPEDQPCPVVLEPDFTKPAAAPTGLRVRMIQNRDFTVSWVDTTTTEESFLVHGMPLVSKRVSSSTKAGAGTNYSVTFRNLEPKKHCFRVQASNSEGSGPLSLRVCAEPAAPANDRDRDGINDSTERELLLKFAPQIWLYSTETSFPVSVDWFLSKSRLRFSHAFCPDHELLSWGEVTSDKLPNQIHRNVNSPPICAPWKCCDHEGPELRSSSYRADPRESYFLQLPDSAHSGSSDPSTWTLYGHAYPAMKGGIALQYWQFYAYNDSIQTINHEGDWEFTAVLLNQNGDPIRVAYSRHGLISDRRREEVTLLGDRHVTFSAKGSHAQYARAHDGSLAETCVDVSIKDTIYGELFARDKCDKGISWTPWTGQIINMGERYFGSLSWLRYSGLWGEIGALETIPAWLRYNGFLDEVRALETIPGIIVSVTSGPSGPAYKDDSWRLWVSPELCGNLSDDDLDGQIDEQECIVRSSQ